MMPSWLPCGNCAQAYDLHVFYRPYADSHRRIVCGYRKPPRRTRQAWRAMVGMAGPAK